jgi:YfiR/HmsC-like
MVLLAVVAFGSAARLEAQTPVYFDSEVKAAFLYHFGTYTEWPEPADDVVTIAVLGADLVVEHLEAFLKDKMIDGRPVAARRIADIDEIADARILFIGAGENERLELLVEALSSRPVLIVADSPSGLQDGATINFRLVQNRVRFEISLPAARRAGLQLSSRLLSAALEVEPLD